jgi:hypothetical protein
VNRSLIGWHSRTLFAKSPTSSFLFVSTEITGAFGGSNHSNGNAVDLARTVNGHSQPNDHNDQKAWKASWEYWWLRANAAHHGFKNYPKEA